MTKSPVIKLTHQHFPVWNNSASIAILYHCYSVASLLLACCTRGCTCILIISTEPAGCHQACHQVTELRQDDAAATVRRKFRGKFVSCGIARHAGVALSCLSRVAICLPETSQLLHLHDLFWLSYELLAQKGGSFEPLEPPLATGLKFMRLCTCIQLY